MISSGESTGSTVPATSGAPTSAAIFLAETLSPRSRIAFGGGPIQIKPAAITKSAKSALQDIIRHRLLYKLIRAMP